MDLRPYQEEAIQEILKARDRKVTRQLLVLATGLGKTVIMGGLIHRLGFPKTFGFMHREEILLQSRNKIHAFDPAVRVGIEKAAERVDLEKDTIALASVQTVGRQNTKRLSRFDKDWPSLVWVDEAHHAPASSYKQVLQHFSVFGEDPKRDRLFIGTTATPDRFDGSLYDGIFDDVVYRYGLREGIQDGWLADIKGFQVDVDLDLSKVKVRMGDFVNKQLARAILQSNLNDVAVRTWQDRCANKKSIFFCVSKDHAERFRDQISSAGAKAAVIVDETSREERAAILSLYEKGDLNVLVNVGVLTEGFDCESIECVHILRPTRSRTVYTQMIGRGTRKIPGVKESVDVFDYANQGHDICSIGPLFGLPVLWKMKGQSVLEEAERVEVIQAEMGLPAHGSSSLEELLDKLVHRRIRMVIGGITDSGLPSSFAWLRPSREEEKWVLAWENDIWADRDWQCNKKTRDILKKHRLMGAAERFEIFKNEIGNYEAQWISVSAVGKERRMKVGGDSSLTGLVQQLEKKLTDGRSHQVPRLQKFATWRNGPASVGQKAKLLEMGVPDWIVFGLPSGEADSLLHCGRGVLEMMFKDIKKPPGKVS